MSMPQGSPVTPAGATTSQPQTRPTPAEAAHALEITNLVVSYGAKRAVDGLDLAVRQSEIFGLLGPNGAGKTSTLSAVEGLLRPAAGTILIGGSDVRTDPAAAKASLGVQLQATSFQAELTIAQIVNLYARLYGVVLTKNEMRQQLAAIHLDAEAHKRFRHLSGGQQQRLSLLIATIHNPPLVLLDEPTAGLDPQARRQLWERIETMRQSAQHSADDPFHGRGAGGL